MRARTVTVRALVPCRIVGPAGSTQTQSTQ